MGTSLTSARPLFTLTGADFIDSNAEGAEGRGEEPGEVGESSLALGIRVLAYLAIQEESYPVSGQ